ncbi:hypothetical protein MZM54_03400 [[Brevibacterium] frigoritolerans]|nr:hypothetical protein [Peribacillus frigoritolerans]
MLRSLKKSELESMERIKLIALYKDLEDYYVYGKKSTNVFIHIMSYFLAVSLLTIVSTAFVDVLKTFHPFYLFSANILIILFGIFLIIRGIIIVSQSRRYFATILLHMETIQNTLQQKEQQNK